MINTIFKGLYSIILKDYIPLYRHIKVIYMYLSEKKNK